MRLIFLFLACVLDKGEQHTVWIENNKLFRSPRFDIHRHMRLKKSFRLILLVKSLDIGHLNTTRRIPWKRRLCREPHMHFYRVSCENGIVSVLMERLKAKLLIKGEGLADSCCRENGHRTAQSCSLL